MLLLMLFIEWQILEEHFNSLCNALPHNYQLTIAKLETIPQLFKDDREQLKKLVSSPNDVRKINEKIITYLFVKLCYSGSKASLGRLCDVMDGLIASSNTAHCVQQVRYGK